ncbi:MAG: PDZ domain-containing protein [Verrucomicrobiales bacterium]|nr:PDZ domain-containing protein [Verrucomicrobiales bacterium]
MYKSKTIQLLAAILLSTTIHSPNVKAQGTAKVKTPIIEIVPSPSSSLVRINATLQRYNFIRPWEKGAPTPRRGLGAFITGKQVLTTAELVENSTYIELELTDTGEKTPAKIVGLDYEANLALLEPIDAKSKILDKLIPLKLDDSVVSGDRLEIWQVEDNGNSVTTDVKVLRVAIANYFIPGSRLLSYQVKGSLQYHANSYTLPVIKDGKLAGLLLSYSSKEQTSTLLPSPIIQHFLDDLKDGDYKGFANLGMAYAQTLDEQLRKFTHITDKKGGVFVRRVIADSSAGKGGVKTGDVILSVNGHTIDSRGYYLDARYGKLNFSHLVRGAAKVGDQVKMNIIRDGKVMDLKFPLLRKKPSDYLVDPYMFDRGPRFMILGGLIFQELTLPYLKFWGDKWPTRGPLNLVNAQANPEPYEKEGRKKIVFLSQVVKTPATIGYQGFGSIILTQVNGQKINDIQDLAEAFKKPNPQGLHKIEFTDHPKVIYLDAKMALTINQQLSKYGIGQLQNLD